MINKFEPIPLSPGETARAWEFFNNSPMRIVLHNELLKKLSTLRSELETVTPDALVDLQNKIEAHKLLFNIIHRNDALPTK